MRKTLTSSAAAARRASLPSIRSSRFLPVASIPGLSTALRQSALRPFTSTSTHLRGILPDTEDPQPPGSAEQHSPLTPAEITDKEYHELADEYLDRVLSKLEELQDKREDIDVEYSVRQSESASIEAVQWRTANNSPSDRLGFSP
jgi:frataxin